MCLSTFCLRERHHFFAHAMAEVEQRRWRDFLCPTMAYRELVPLRGARQTDKNTLTHLSVTAGLD
jgi:hypothetical protein